MILVAALLQVEPGLDDHLLQPRAFAGILCQVALHLGQLALVLQHAVARDVTIAGQRAQVVQLFAQRVGLGLQVTARAAHAGQLGLGAVNAGSQRTLLAGLGLAAAVEQLALAFDNQPQLRVVIAQQLGGEHQVRPVVALGLPTRQAGAGSAVLGLQGIDIGLHLGAVKAEQRLALVHLLALADQNPADHPGAIDCTALRLPDTTTVPCTGTLGRAAPGWPRP